MKTLNISNRGRNVPKSAIRKLIPLAKEAEKKGINVIKLNIGQPDIKTPEEFWTGVRDFGEKVLAYSPSEGRPEYLKALVTYFDRFGISLSESDLLATTGGIEGVLYGIMTAADPDDEIIVLEPYYSNYTGVAAMAQITFVPYTTTAEQGYHLPEDLSDLEKLITDKTKAILFSNPGNPTGCVYSRDEVERLAAIGKKHNLFLLSDEVYREFIYNDQPATSILHIPDMEKHGVILDSVSKRYSACGARIGCIASKNRDFMASANALATVRLSAPTLEQIGIANCINTPDTYFEEVRKEYMARRDIVVDRLSKIDDVICRRPEGAFYVMAKIIGVDTEDFARWLLTDFSLDGDTVLVAPAAGFYSTDGLGRDEIRIAYIYNTDVTKRAMAVLSEAIKKYREQKV